VSDGTDCACTRSNLPGLAVAADGSLLAWITRHAEAIITGTVTIEWFSSVRFLLPHLTPSCPGTLLPLMPRNLALLPTGLAPPRAWRSLPLTERSRLFSKERAAREKSPRAPCADTLRPCLVHIRAGARKGSRGPAFRRYVFAQSGIMPTRFFESGAQKTESIIAFNCSVRRSVSFRSKRSPRHSSLETGANMAARLKLRGKAELKTHRDAYDEHCIQRRHPAPTSVPCQVNCQWRYRRPVHILSYVKIMTPFDLTTARGLRPRDG
jgi:hypothetical protein